MWRALVVLCRRSVAVCRSSLWAGGRSVNVRWPPEPPGAVLVTGCDSGIGLCAAQYLASRGCLVFAGVLSRDGPGAAELRAARDGVVILPLDVTDPEQVRGAVATVEQTLADRGLGLRAVVNNAGVMVFGEFEWQTEDQMAEQLAVNVLGYMRVAKAFFPLLHKYKGRLVNVSSHCAGVPLPCLSVYSASKAAVEAWSSALRLETHKAGVPVITIHPGSFARESCILFRQREHAEAMRSAFSPEQRSRCIPLFEEVMRYMGAVSCPALITDPALWAVLEEAVFSRKPRQTYANSPWRYAIYYWLIGLASPFWRLRRRLILAFVSLPGYR